MEDLERAGGVYAVMKELTKKDLLDTSLLTCTGKTVAENLAPVQNLDPTVIRPLDVYKRQARRFDGMIPLVGALTNQDLRRTYKLLWF